MGRLNRVSTRGVAKQEVCLYEVLYLGPQPQQHFETI